MTRPPVIEGTLVLPTPLGHIGLAWSATGLARLVLPAGADAVRRNLGHAGAAAVPPPHISALAGAIECYAQGEAVDFSFVEIDFGAAGPFELSVWIAARRIAHGRTETYGTLAAALGDPCAARAVGAALGRNPVPLIVPCHRVLAAGGRLGGFSAPGGADAKARLLIHERADTAPSLPGQGTFAF